MVIEVESQKFYIIQVRNASGLWVKFRKPECAEWSKSVSASANARAGFCERDFCVVIVVGKSVPLSLPSWPTRPGSANMWRNTRIPFPRSIREVPRKRSWSLYSPSRRNETRDSNPFEEFQIFLEIFFSILLFMHIFDDVKNACRWNYCGKTVDIYSRLRYPKERSRINEKRRGRKRSRTLSFLCTLKLSTRDSHFSTLVSQNPPRGPTLNL